MHDRPGCKKPRPPCGSLRAAVGTIWEAKQTRRPERKEMSAAPSTSPAEKSYSRNKREADPLPFRGRPMTQGKKQVSALCGTVVVEGQASEERFAEITSGRSSGQRGLVATRQDSWNEAVAEGRESPAGLAQESVGARTEGQRPPRRRSTPPHFDGNIEIGRRDSGHLAVSSSARGPDTEPAIRRRMGWNEAVGKPAEVGVYANQRLNFAAIWEGCSAKYQGFKRYLRNSTVRHYRRASENVAMAEL